MRKIFDKNLVEAYLEGSTYREELSSLNVDFFLTQYDKEELVVSPLQENPLFQVVEQGRVNIYFIRDDGSRYALSDGRADYFLGDMEFFFHANESIYAQARENLICLAFDIEKNREAVLSNCVFLALLCKSLAQKIRAITAQDAVPTSLQQRVRSYIHYKCEGDILSGVEHAAFQLHCSARQLQRVLNQMEKQGLVRKLKKGTYQLLEKNGSSD